MSTIDQPIKPTPRAGRRARRYFSAVVLGLLVCSGAGWAGSLPGNRWDLLTVAFPPGRGITVSLGGAEKTLTARGTCSVKSKQQAAAFEIEIEELKPASEIGWTGRQYVLWAVDRENRAVNLGLVPLRGKSAKWSVQVPFRVFGLLVTAEQDPKATAPSSAVALESLLPTNPDLVVPVYRVEVALTPAQG